MVAQPLLSTDQLPLTFQSCERYNHDKYLKMILTRRKILVKLSVLTLYLIVVLIIAKKFFLLNNISNYNENPYPFPQRSGKDFPERRTIIESIDEYHAKERYERWISENEKHVIPGLGEYGQPAYLAEDERAKGEAALAKKALNVVLSEKISLTRNLPDVRDPLCINVTYDNSLPTASIVIIFFNEPWSVLLRTVHSVLRRSPPRLLKEIVLVDDNSEEEELQGKLEYYLRTRLPRKVRLLRLKRRQGLIRARLHGAENCSGDVLVFLDAHCEVIQDWLQPLLQRIEEKRDAVLMPIIDNISEETLEYFHENEASFFQVGGFTWSGHFTWINIQTSEMKSRPTPISPTRSPTMAGGLFAIDRKYFWEIGSYDDKMDGWGGENLEMSFRVWQCGGTLETIPCSRVGHIFRNFHPYKFPNDKDTHGINTARLAFVWMDEYKRLFLLHRNEFKENPELVGDIRERGELRRKLRCKDFKWYLNNVYPEKFIPDENVVAYGRVKLRERHLCLDNLQHDEDKPYNLGLYGCHEKLYPSQLFSLSNTGELRRDETCARVIDTDASELYAEVLMSNCNSQTDSKEWSLSEDGKIMHIESGLCLDGTDLSAEQNVIASTCKDTPDQFWQFDFYEGKLPFR